MNMNVSRGALKLLGLSLVLLSAILLVYWRVFHYTFIADDWGYLYDIISKSAADYFRDAFSPVGKLTNQYRPVAFAYLFVMYKLFGLNATTYHAFAIFIHFCNSILVVYIVQKLTNNQLIAWTTGLLYATAINILIEPLLWASGIFELGGAFFLLLSIALFLNRRVTLSSAAFMLALLTKESTLFLPVLLLVYVLILQQRSTPIRSRLKDLISKLWPFLIVLVVYFGLRSRAVSPFSLPADNPYKITLWGMHIFNNAFYYLKCVFVTIVTPANTFLLGHNDFEPGFYVISWRRLLIFLGALCILLGFGLGRIKDTIVSVIVEGFKSSVLWIAWLVLGIAPVLFVPNHYYRYYVLLALPSVIVLFLLCVRKLVLVLRCHQRHVATIFGVLVLISIISASYYFYLRDNEGVNSRELEIAAARRTDIVQNGLLEAHPTLPENSVLVFDSDSVCTQCFWYDVGPRVWYADDTIEVFDGRFLHVASDGIYIETQAGQRTYLDPQRTFYFRVVDNKLVEIQLSTLNKSGE